MKKLLVALCVLCLHAIALAVVPQDRNPYTPGWWNNPAYYGGKSDSSASNKTALRSAISRGDTLRGVGVEQPAGVWRYDDSTRISLHDTKTNGTMPRFVMKGELQATRIYVNSTSGFLELYADTSGNGHGGFTIQDMDFYAVGSAVKQAIYIHNIGDGTIKNCRFYGFDVGLRFVGAQQINVIDCRFEGCDTAAVVDGQASPLVYANQINFYGCWEVGASRTTSIGLWVRNAQDGKIDGGHWTNNLIGFSGQTGPVAYDIQNAHFEQNRYGLRLETGTSDFTILGNEFSANNFDIYNVGSARMKALANLFDDTLCTGAGSVSSVLIANIGAANTTYLDSVAFPSNSNSYAWNRNTGSGNLPTGIRGVTPGGELDDFSLMSPGTLDILYKVIAGGSSGSIWTRMQPQGSDVAHAWGDGKAGWMLLDGTDDTVASFYATTNAAAGWTFETYTGSSNGDSTVARLSILGNQARTTIKIGPEHTISMWFWDRITGTDSLMIGVDTARKVLLACDGNGDCIPLIRDSIGGGADSVMQYMAALRGALLRPYWGWYHSTIGRDSVWAFPITREMLIGSDSNIAISSTRRTTIGNPAWGHGFTKFMGHLIYNYFSTIGDSLIAYRAHDTISGPLPDGYVWTIDSVGHRMYWAPPTGGTTANDSSLYVIDAHTMMYIAQWISPGFFNFKNDSAGVQGLTIGSNTDNVTFTGKHITAIADTTLKAGVTRFNGHLVFAMIDTTGTDSVFWLELADSTNNLPTDGWALKFRAADTSMYFGAVSGGSGETDTTGIAGVQNGTTGFGMVSDSLGTRKTIRQIKEGSFIAGAYSGDTAVTISVDTAGLVVTRALRADSANKVTDGSITGGTAAAGVKIAATTITGANLATNAVDLAGTKITGTLAVGNGGTGVTSSTGSVNVVLSQSPTFSGTPIIPSPTLTIKNSNTPTPTTEGVIEWDADDNRIAVGDGAATKRFMDSASAKTVYDAAYLAKSGGQMTGAITTSSAGAWDLSSLTSIALRTGEIVTGDILDHTISQTDIDTTGSLTMLTLFQKNGAVADSQCASLDYVKQKSGAKGHWRMPDRWAHGKDKSTGDSLILMFSRLYDSGSTVTDWLFWDITDSCYEAATGTTAIKDTFYCMWQVQANEERLDSVMLQIRYRAGATSADSSAVESIRLLSSSGRTFAPSATDTTMSLGWVTTTGNQTFILNNNDYTTPDPGEWYFARIITHLFTNTRIAMNLSAFWSNP